MMMTLADLAGFAADPVAQDDMRRRAMTLAQLAARGFTTGLLGGPVDIANMAMGGAGGEKPVMGSEWIGDKLGALGLLAQKPKDAVGSAVEFGGGLLNPGGALKGAAAAAALAAKPAKAAAKAHPVRVESTGSRGDQLDLEYSVWDGDKPMGYAQVSVYQGKPQIDMIEVAPHAKRQGVAKSIVQQLADDFGYKNIGWGMMTDDGSALKRAMDALLGQ